MSVYQARVNQKLYFARLHLEALEAVEQGTDWSKHAKIESFHESVLFHLACAYTALLREIAEQYRLPLEQIETLADLAAAAEAAGLEAPEIGRLQVLEQQSDSWLVQLLGAYRACWKAKERPESPAEGSSLSEIHVVQVNPDHAEDPAVHQQLTVWMDELRALVSGLREEMREW